MKVKPKANKASQEKPMRSMREGMKPKEIKCPVCEAAIETGMKECPNCKVELKEVMLADPSKSRGASWGQKKVVVADPDTEKTKVAHQHYNITSATNKTSTEKTEPHPEKLISDPGETPAIYDTGERVLTNRFGQDRTVKTFRVEYNGIIYTGWVYCPSCWRKLFQNQMIDNGYVQQEYQCKDCYAITAFVFNSNRNPIRMNGARL